MGASVDEFPLLAAHGLYVADTAGNGNCLFNALSDQIYGTQSSHHNIRSRVIEYMREHGDYYKQFIEVHPGGGVRRNPKRKNAGAYSTPTNYTPPTPEEINRVFEDHLQQMARGGTYGDNMEIHAFTAAFGVDVKIYQRDFAYMISGSHEAGERPVAHVAYHVWEHYSSIRNIKGPHTGLPKVSPSYVSPELEKETKDRLSKTSYVQPWMANVIVQSLPYTPDQSTIHKALEDCKGNIDHAVSNLLDAEERGSVSSTQGSSSVEREHDCDEEGLSGPNKKQDRRLSRATRLVNKEKDEQRKRELALRVKKKEGQPATNGHSQAPSERRIDGLKSETAIDNDDDDEGWQDDPTYKDSESASVSASEYSTADKPLSTGVRLKLSQPKRENGKDPPANISSHPERTLNERSSHDCRTEQRQPGPKQKRVTQRDKRDIKKAAQKAAAKERKQGIAVGKAVNGKNGAIAIVSKQGKENSPAIESVIRTLYI